MDEHESKRPKGFWDQVTHDQEQLEAGRNQVRALAREACPTETGTTFWRDTRPGDTTHDLINIEDAAEDLLNATGDLLDMSWLEGAMDGTASSRADERSDNLMLQKMAEMEAWDLEQSLVQSSVPRRSPNPMG